MKGQDQTTWWRKKPDQKKCEDPMESAKKLIAGWEVRGGWVGVKSRGEGSFGRGEGLDIRPGGDTWWNQYNIAKGVRQERRWSENMFRSKELGMIPKKGPKIGLSSKENGMTWNEKKSPNGGVFKKAKENDGGAEEGRGVRKLKRVSNCR